MRKYFTTILFGAVLFAAPASVNAQETLIIDGKEVTRVVIAPARTPIARIIKTGLKNNYRAAAFETRPWYDAQKLYYFYGARHFEPLWLSQDDSGKTIFSPNASSIVSIFENAYMSGLKPEDYLTDDINLDLIGTDPDQLASLETAFSAATMRYAQDSFGGSISPSSVSRTIDLKPNRINSSQLLLQLANSSNPAEILAALEPEHREYKGLKTALARFYDGSAIEEDIIEIPDGKTLRPGDSDPRVSLIRKRLGIDIKGVQNNLYDDALLAGVEKFQAETGLTIDGIIGPATVAALNGGNAATKSDIIANMERWRWMPRDLGDFNVFVNIPEFRLAINKDGEEVHSTRVVVGKPKFKTSIFSDEIEHVVVNPYWNVPRSILNNELGPSIRSNPGYLASQNMELLAGGKVVNASSVDWSTTSLSQFRVRQRPGPRNALGSVKFLFPNKHSIYLHDTPSKSLFSRSRRAYSHGCVRVKNPWEFAEALLTIEPKISYASLVAQRGNSKGERWNNLATHIPVHLAYFTLRVDKNGSIRSYGDVYGHNKKLKALMGL